MAKIKAITKTQHIDDDYNDEDDVHPLLHNIDSRLNFSVSKVIPR